MALENVPHSDGDLDDPFRYLASQIMVKQEQLPSQREYRTVSNHGLAHTTTMETVPSYGAETATPSETSKRETLQTDATTPMTTPGVTPGETGKRFSDVGKRPLTAQPSGWRPGSNPAKTNVVYSFLNGPLPSKPSLVTAASKSMTNLSDMDEERSKQHKISLTQNIDTLAIGRPDFNKSLPSIPRFTTEQMIINDQRKEKHRGITRMLRTVGLHKTHSSTTVAPKSTSTEFASKQKESLQRPPTKKTKFNPFTFLQKRTSVNTKRTTVG